MTSLDRAAAPIARVEPLTTARALRGPFDYRLPEELGEVGVGSVVVVPFGSRRVLGVVVDLAERSELPAERLAEPIEALEAGATPELVELGLWTAREYCSTPSRGLSLVLPPGTGPGGRRVASRRELRASATPAGRAAGRDGGARLGTLQRAALVELAGGEHSAAELATRCGADRAALRRLQRRGLVELREVPVARRAARIAVGDAASEVEPSPAQRQATEAIAAAISGRGDRELLLHGVTGSGKTEVYLAAAERALRLGRGTIVLVPEIALTPQAAERFRARLGDRVAVLHSGLGEGERYDEWRRLRSGEARVCVGPRSAVFAPVGDLGLVVIDEEHDASYKQEGDPRYDARTVARRRAGAAGAALVAGSATPRPESWMELPRLELAERVDGRPMPAVEVLDMRERAGGSGPLHPRTLAALAKLRATGGKAMVLLNRRGWAPHLSCRECGRSWRCTHCDVSLVLHRHVDRLACHHCGRTEPLPRACPDCGSVTIARHGAGTERLEALLRERLDPVPVFRLDADTASRRGAHADVLRRFDAAPAGLLLGTQMVAKGHDFAAVTLAVVVDADAALRFPDFRAEERTFALVAQLAGRSGRGAAPGRVLVQTLAPGAEAIRRAARHDAPGFLAGELERRRALRYPPFATLLRVELAAPRPEPAQAAARAVAGRLGDVLPPSAELLGPAPRPRLRARHRRQLLVKASEREPALAAVRSAIDAAVRARELRGASLAVDVDPQ